VSLAVLVRNLAKDLAEGCSVRVYWCMDNQEESVFMMKGVTVEQEKTKIKGVITEYLAKEETGQIVLAAIKWNIVEVPDWLGITSFISPKNVQLVIHFCMVRTLVSLDSR
jgi:hypothetical protein